MKPHSNEQQGADQAHKDRMIELASLAFERDFPQLLKDHEGKWVAYHGEKQIGFAQGRPELWQTCERLGLPEGEFWVFNIQPIIGVESIGLGGAYWDAEES